VNYAAHYVVRRTGFTLTEMLTVMLIIGLLSSIVIGSLFRGRTVNKLIASEQVLSDCIRQARHTARSSGAPVILKLQATKKADGSPAGGVIVGLSQTMLWNENFEHGKGPKTKPYTYGMSGSGILITHEDKWVPPTLDRDLRFRPGDGIYVALAVRPPLASSRAGYIPLFLVGDDDKFPLSSFGLMLVSSDAVDPRNAIIQNHPNGSAKMLAWEVLGWVTDPKTKKFTYISSFDNLPADLVRDRQILPSKNYDIPEPIGGDHWEEIGMLITMDQMVLYRNGNRIAELRAEMPDHKGRTVTLPKQLAAGKHIWVGQATDIVRDTTSAYCPIDDVRLMKIGQENVGNLPQGVYPMPDPALPRGTLVEYRIVAHPEGRVELSSAIGADTRTAVSAGLNIDQAVATGTIFLGGDFTRAANQSANNQGANSAMVSVAIDGRVHGQALLIPTKKTE
jgi:prepilin-type N-terminal cleavage/methylation domain-containing protein